MTTNSAQVWTCPDCQTVSPIDPDSEIQCDFCGLMKFEAEELYRVCPRCDHSHRQEATYCGHCETPLPST